MVRIKYLIATLSFVLLLLAGIGPPGDVNAAPASQPPRLEQRNHTYVVFYDCGRNIIQKAGHTTSSYIHTLAPVRMMTYYERQAYCYRW